MSSYVCVIALSLFYPCKQTGAVLGIFIWVGHSKAKQILGRPTEVVSVGIMGTRAVWVGQERVWVGHGPPGLIARTASVNKALLYVTFQYYLDCIVVIILLRTLNIVVI